MQRFSVTFGLLALGLFFVTGCQDKSAVTTPVAGSDLKGKILIDGSSTVKPIGEAVANRFNKLHPGVSVDVGGRGTGNGFKLFENKETDISEASRPVKPSELEKLKAAGISFLELPVAYDGLTIVIHPENDWVQQLTIDQLKQIFLKADNATTWKDVDANWPEEQIKLFAPGTGSGTYDYFKEVVGEDIREDMSFNEDDNALVVGVAGNKYSIGFFGVAYFNENREKLQAVPIFNPELEKAFLPEKENIENNNYAPFSRPLFVYVSTESLKRSEMQAFVSFYIEEVSGLVENVGYVKLPDSIMERAQILLDDPEASAGTCFVDAQGNSRKGRLDELFNDANRIK